MEENCNKLSLKGHIEFLTGANYEGVIKQKSPRENDELWDYRSAIKVLRSLRYKQTDAEKETLFFAHVALCLLY